LLGLNSLELELESLSVKALAEASQAHQLGLEFVEM
jgi:hypothetical protein